MQISSPEARIWIIDIPRKYVYVFPRHLNVVLIISMSALSSVCTRKDEDGCPKISENADILLSLSSLADAGRSECFARFHATSSGCGSRIQGLRLLSGAYERKNTRPCLPTKYICSNHNICLLLENKGDTVCEGSY